MSEQPLPAWQDVLGDAEQLVKQKFIYPKYIKGTILENDVPVWIADFALRLLQRDRATRGVPACSRCGKDSTTGRHGEGLCVAAGIVLPPPYGVMAAETQQGGSDGR